jgi:hypothetical protein
MCVSWRHSASGVATGISSRACRTPRSRSWRATSASKLSMVQEPDRRAASSTARACTREQTRARSTAQRSGGTHGSPYTVTTSASGRAVSWRVMPRRRGTTAPGGTTTCTSVVRTTPKPYTAAAVWWVNTVVGGSTRSAARTRSGNCDQSGSTEGGQLGDGGRSPRSRRGSAAAWSYTSVMADERAVGSGCRATPPTGVVDNAPPCG